MKKCCAWMLALCMLFSAASAEMQIGTEALLKEVLESIAQAGTFWLDYAGGQTKLAGGVTMDENDLPGVGLRYQDAETDLYAALDAQGVRMSDGVEVIHATWEELTGISPTTAAAPQLTQADGELIGTVLGEMAMPVLNTVRMNTTTVQLDEQPAQCMELVVPLREACEALNQSVPAALNAHADELNQLIARNQDFLRSLGVRMYSVQSMVYGWWDLKVGELCKDDTAVTIRWTESAHAWKLEASVKEMGLEVHFDGMHADGRFYAFGREWAFDSRDLETVLKWAKELALQISPDAFDFSFAQSRGTTHLHLKADVEKWLMQLGSGVQHVLGRYSGEAQAILDRYAPFFGADMTVEELVHEAQQALDRMLAQWRMRNRGRLGTVSSVVEADFYTADGNISLRVKSPVFHADVRYDDYGVDVDAGVTIRRRSYEATAHGLWNADSLQMNGTLGTDGSVNTRWELSGAAENGARVFSLTANNEWLGTATLRDSSVELTAKDGWQASLLWSKGGVRLHGAHGDEAMDASARWTDGQFTAQVSMSALNADLLIREENGGGRVQFQYEQPHGKTYQKRFALEGAATGDQLMFKVGSYLKSQYEEAALWEVGADMRENRAGGTLTNRRTQASFQWSPGMLSAQSLYRMSGLTVDTGLLVTDITTPGTGDYNTTQIRWNQQLQYAEEMVDHNHLYTVHTTAGDRALHFAITDENGDYAQGHLVLLDEPASPAKLLGLDEQPEAEPLPEPEPQPEAEPAAEPEPTKKPSGGMFLTRP